MSRVGARSGGARGPHYAVECAVETDSDKDHLHLPLPAARALILYETGEESMNFVTLFFVVSLSVEFYVFSFNLSKCITTLPGLLL